MKRYLIADGIQIILAIVLTGTMVYAMTPTAIETLQSAPKTETVQVAIIEPKAPEKPIETAPEAPKTITWQDNPNNCDQSTQYIAAEEPFECLTKTNQPATGASTTSAPASATSGGCDIAYNNIMRAICMGESGGNPNAVGDNYVIAGLYAPSCGLWQIRTLKGRPTCEELKNPQTNLEWAWKISNQGTNWKPWTVYGSGAYLKYI